MTTGSGILACTLVSTSRAFPFAFAALLELAGADAGGFDIFLGDSIFSFVLLADNGFLFSPHGAACFAWASRRRLVNSLSGLLFLSLRMAAVTRVWGSSETNMLGSWALASLLANFRLEPVLSASGAVAAGCFGAGCGAWAFASGSSGVVVFAFVSVDLTGLASGDGRRFSSSWAGGSEVRIGDGELCCGGGMRAPASVSTNRDRGGGPSSGESVRLLESAAAEHRA
jgi:hypothetical protein